MKRYNKYTKSGHKYYQLRDSKGRFAGTQMYRNAQAADLRKCSKAELSKKHK